MKKILSGRTGAYIVTGLLVGGSIVGGARVYAFGLNRESIPKVFSSFSSHDQNVIQQAIAIRKQAEDQVKDLLSKNGIDIKDVRDAERAYAKESRSDFAEVLKSDDYEAYLDLIEGTPMEGKIDKETFEKLVDAHNLRQSGDKEGANTILKELRLKRHPLPFTRK